MVKKNACIFISGFGSNLKSLIRSSRDPVFPIKINLVITNNPNAQGILHAKKYSIPFLIINTRRRDYENIILREINKNKISIICLAGYMKIISKRFIFNAKKKILNIHPSLLPKYKGLNTFEKVVKNKEKKTGCTVHYVNENLDSGTIISQKSFDILINDNENTLRKKTQRLEYSVFPQAIIKIFRYN